MEAKAAAAPSQPSCSNSALQDGAWIHFLWQGVLEGGWRLLLGGASLVL